MSEPQDKPNEGLFLALPPGYSFTPLYKNCPKCGCNLSKENVPSGYIRTGRKWMLPEPEDVVAFALVAILGFMVVSVFGWFKS